MSDSRNGKNHEGRIETYVRDYFAQRSVHPDSLPDVMFKHIYTGAMGSIWGTLIAGIFLIYFGNRIGLTPFEWGVMASIGSWVLLTEMVSAAITQRVGHRKLIWFCCALLDRILRFAGILAALILWYFGRPHAGMVLIVAMSVATCLGAMAGPPWWSWLADIIPEKEHGEFWGRRSAWIAVATVAVCIPAALLMDWAPERLKLYMTLAVFAAATILGLVDLVIHGTIPEPKMAASDKGEFLQQLKAPLRDRGFRPFLLFSFSWTFAVMLGATLILIYMMEDLGCKNHFLGTLMATTGAFLAGCVLTATWTGRLIDEWGPKKVMWFGYVFWAFIPFWWLFLTPGSILWIIATVNFVAGLFVTAGSNAYLKIQTRYPPAGHRAMYVAVSNSANYVASALAALAAGVIVRWLDGWSWTWPNGWHFGRYDVLAAGSLALRVATVIFLLRGIRESPPETGLPGQPLASSGDFWGGKEWGTGA